MSIQVEVEVEVTYLYSLVQHSLKGYRTSFVNYKKGWTQLAAASDNVYQLLAQGRWFSPGTPASSTTKTGRHDIAEILLKVALNTKIQIQIQILKMRLICFWELIH
jgi:hypothetical protein